MANILNSSHFPIRLVVCTSSPPFWGPHPPLTMSLAMAGTAAPRGGYAALALAPLPQAQAPPQPVAAAPPPPPPPEAGVPDIVVDRKTDSTGAVVTRTYQRGRLLGKVRAVGVRAWGRCGAGGVKLCGLHPGAPQTATPRQQGGAARAHPLRALPVHSPPPLTPPSHPTALPAPPFPLRRAALRAASSSSTARRTAPWRARWWTRRR